MVALMNRATPNQGRLLPHVEGEPNFYEIDRNLRLPPLPLEMNHGRGRNPSTTNAGGDVVFAPHSYPYPHPHPPPLYPPPPPPPHLFHGNPTDPHTSAAYPIYSGQYSYPQYHPMPYGPPPALPGHYTNFSHPFHPHYGAQSRYDIDPPSSNTDHAWSEEISATGVPPQYPMQYDRMQSAQHHHPHLYNDFGPQYNDEQPQTTPPASQDSTGAVQTKSPNDDLFESQDEEPSISKLL